MILSSLNIIIYHKYDDDDNLDCSAFLHRRSGSVAGLPGEETARLIIIIIIMMMMIIIMMMMMNMMMKIKI